MSFKDPLMCNVCNMCLPNTWKFSNKIPGNVVAEAKHLGHKD